MLHTKSLEKEYTVHKKLSGRVADKDVWRILLSDGTMEVEITNIGCAIMKILVPDQYGNKDNVVAAYGDALAYLDNPLYLGCIVGRYTNRIAKGKLVLNNQPVQLSQNDGDNHLHGGFKGFHSRIWELRSLTASANGAGVSFAYTSPHGEEGYPGTLQVITEYRLKDGFLEISYTATTDAATVISLTNHSFFNLSGFAEPTIYHHLLQVNAQWFTPVNDALLPTGAITNVHNTLLDMQQPVLLGKAIEAATLNGFDINFALRTTPEPRLLTAAILSHPASGRSLWISTNQPGIQVFTANNWNGDGIFKQHAAIALETQSFPDSPNQPAFPFRQLQPGEQYRSKTVLSFSW